MWATELFEQSDKQMRHTWCRNRAVECEDHLRFDSAYLQHDGADVSHTLSDGLWSARDCDSSLCWVRQHVSCHLNLSACGLNTARQKKKQRPFSTEKPTLSTKLKCCLKYPQIILNTFRHTESSCKPNSNVCSNIWRGTHKYCPFKISMQPPLVFIGTNSRMFMSSNQRKTLEVWVECLTHEVSEHQRRCSLSLWVQKNNSLIKNWKKDSYLSDLFDFWASFANQWATLAPWENQAECHRWLACHIAVCHCCANILRENSKNVFLTDCKKGNIFDESFLPPLSFTSSNFCAIMEKALKIPSVAPVMVTILSGDDPSDMLMRAPL